VIIACWDWDHEEDEWRGRWRKLPSSRAREEEGKEAEEEEEEVVVVVEEEEEKKKDVA